MSLILGHGVYCFVLHMYVVVCVTDIIKESLRAYFADDMPHFKTVVIFDCRGVEPTNFEPRVCPSQYYRKISTISRTRV